MGRASRMSQLPNEGHPQLPKKFPDAGKLARFNSTEGAGDTASGATG